MHHAEIKINLCIVENITLVYSMLFVICVSYFLTLTSLDGVIPNPREDAMATNVREDAMVPFHVRFFHGSAG